MDEKLKKLFDFQRFEQSPKLAKLIAETETHGKAELEDDQLMFVAAAGEIETANGLEDSLIHPPK